MALTKTLTLNKQATLILVKFIAIMGIASLAPLFPIQGLTGPIVNAMLFIAVIMLGSQSAILVAVFPSTIALATGLLPAILAPMIPFIIIGNIILVLTFDLFRKENFWLGVGVASFLKFLFLWSPSSVVIELLIKKDLANKVAMMLSWSQLITAVAGGVLAYIFLKKIKRI